jgi:hypothetical protein
MECARIDENLKPNGVRITPPPEGAPYRLGSLTYDLPWFAGALGITFGRIPDAKLTGNDHEPR